MSSILIAGIGSVLGMSTGLSNLWCSPQEACTERDIVSKQIIRAPQKNLTTKGCLGFDAFKRIITILIGLSGK